MTANSQEPDLQKILQSLSSGTDETILEKSQILCCIRVEKLTGDEIITTLESYSPIILDDPISWCCWGK